MESSSSWRRFLRELRRRNVYRVAVAYLAVTFVGLQAVDLLVPSTTLPPWADEFLVALAVFGFPVALVLAWAFELTPEGMRRTSAVGGVEAGQPTGPSERPGRGGMMALAALGLVGAAAAGGWYLAGAGEPEPRDASLAVLPFDNLSPDPDNAYFAAGIHEEILTQLTKVGGIRVLSRSSVLRYEDTEMSPSEVADELGVATILEGSVRRDADAVRISVQLRETRSGEQLWAESYDRRLSDIFRIQTDVATRVVTELKGVLTPEERAELSRRPTDDLEAYAHFLRGHEHFRRWTEEDARAAAEAYRHAVELDPDFVAAWARLVQARVWLVNQYDAWDERPRARTALRRLEALAPESPELRLARGLWLYYGRRRYAEAIEEFEALSELWPADAEVVKYRGALYRRLGRWEEAIDAWERVLELDPADIQAAGSIAEIHYMRRRFGAAEPYAEMAVSLRPSAPHPWYFLTTLRLLEGDTAAARSVADSSVAHLGLGTGTWLRAYAILGSGRPEEVSDFYHGEPWIPGTGVLDVGLVAAAASGRTQLVEARADSLGVRAERQLGSIPTGNAVERSQALSGLALARAYRGHAEEAMRLADKAVELCSVSCDAFEGPRNVHRQAHVYAVVGRHDEAVERLRYLLSVPSEWVSVPLLRTDPRWDPLRDDPGFAALLEP